MSLRIAIVGASFGGLACARALQTPGGAHVQVDCFEVDCALNAGGEGGGITIPGAPEVLSRLGLHVTWDMLRVQCSSARPFAVPLQDLKQAIANALTTGTIQFGVRVVEVVERTEPQPLRQFHCKCDDGRVRGPYDVVVDATGLFQPLDAQAAIGDALVARGGWWQFGGVRRIRAGADNALKEGVDLGEGLREGRYSPDNLGRYACQRQKRTVTRPSQPQVLLTRYLIGATFAMAFSAILSHLRLHSMKAIVSST